VKSKKITTADARRVHIAASVAAGQSIAATARQIGISREWASRIANAPETQQIITSHLDAHRMKDAGYDLFGSGKGHLIETSEITDVNEYPRLSRAQRRNESPTR
jgi:hypothetical protein